MVHAGEPGYAGRQTTKERESMKAYEAIAQALVAEGATQMFGLMGDGNMWLWNKIGRAHV